MVGIDHTIASIGALRALAVDGIGLVKSGSPGFASIPKAAALLADLYRLAVEISPALTEIKDLDLQESKRLLDALGTMGLDIIVAAGAKP